MRQNFLYRLRFYLQLTLAYSCHYIKERKAKRIFLLRMKQRFIKSLRICVLVHASREQVPNKSVFIKTVSVTSKNLQSMIFIVLRRVPYRTKLSRIKF